MEPIHHIFFRVGHNGFSESGENNNIPRDLCSYGQNPFMGNAMLYLHKRQIHEKENFRKAWWLL